MTAHLLRGDARMLPLATGSVQCITTSPPFFNLRSYGGQVSVWGGDPDCPHTLADGPAVKPMTGGTGAASTKQVTNAGSQFGNAWAEEGKSHQRIRNGQSDSLLFHNGPKKQVTLHPSQGATCTRCGAWKGELGSEPHVALFISHLVEVFRECKRVMRDDAVMFVNIGDGYSGSGKGPSNSLNKNNGHSEGINSGYVPVGTRPKSLLLVPEQLSLALAGFSTVPGAALVQMADELATAREAGDWLMVSAVESQLRIWAAMSAVFDGWIVRSRIAWCKASPMPESVDDRPTSAWEHIWQLTKSNKALFWTHRDGPGQRTQPAPDYRWQKDGVELTQEPEDAKEQGWKRVNLWRGHDYYWDADAVRNPIAQSTIDALKLRPDGSSPYKPNRTIQSSDYGIQEFSGNMKDGGAYFTANPAGANLRNFWLLGPDPYSGAHYATFPKKLVELCVKSASSSYGACAACGAPWRRTTERIGLGALKVRHVEGETPKHDARVEMGLRSNKSGLGGSNSHNGSTPQSPVTTTTGWTATCRCGPAAGVRPCVVLDPFSGSATVPFQAARMGRIGIGVELSESYIKQAQTGRLAQGFLPLAAPPQPAALRLPMDGEVTG